MNCPYCSTTLEDHVTYCGQCGERLTEPQDPALQNPVSDADSDSGEDAISYDTEDPRKLEYKELLREVFAHGRVTPDELNALTLKVKELGLDKAEALSLQKDVAGELGVTINESGDLGSSRIIVEIDANQTFISGTMANLEFRIKNISNDYIDKLQVSTHFVHLDKTIDKYFGRLDMGSEDANRFPFSHSLSGQEVVETKIQLFDSKGNPSVYRMEFVLEIFENASQVKNDRSISISVTADKIMGNDFSDMARVIEAPKTAPKKSFLNDSEKQWMQLYVFFDEEATVRWRNEIFVNNKFSEGLKLLTQGERELKEGESFFKSDRQTAEVYFNKAFEGLSKSIECFRKIREMDPQHEMAFNEITKAKGLISEIEHKIQILHNTPLTPAVHLSSGCFEEVETNKKFYVFSKQRISIGRNSGNDVLLRLIPYTPKEQFPDNYRNSTKISSTHAEIINRDGSFYIKDIGSSSNGSVNGTFLDKKQLKPMKEYRLQDGQRINIARVLDMDCRFLSDHKKADNTLSFSSCQTVMGEIGESCFGIDKLGGLNAIKIKRRNNASDLEQYLILVRKTTIGCSRGNGIVIEGEQIADIHARLFYRDQQYWIEDLNTKHGTRVNGVLIESGVEVSLGQEADVTLGDKVLRFKGF